jgi:hypothetical protein
MQITVWGVPFASLAKAFSSKMHIMDCKRTSAKFATIMDNAVYINLSHVAT